MFQIKGVTQMKSTLSPTQFFRESRKFRYNQTHVNYKYLLRHLITREQLDWLWHNFIFDALI
jgi:hypothetical protein